MSVYCDKIIGYSLDITEEFNKDKTNLRGWIEGDKDKEDKFSSIKFEYYNNLTSDNKVTMIYDGMSGGYCKLVYIIDFYKETEEENNDELIDSINNLLKDSPVPFSAKQTMKSIYRAIFGIDLNKTSSIKAEYIVHWH